MGLHRNGAALRPGGAVQHDGKLTCMSDAQVNPEDAAAAARRLLEADFEAKVTAVRELADAANDADAKEREAVEARERHSRAWDAAMKAGWSDKELRQTGARAPGAAAPKRRTRRASAAAAPTENVDQTSAEYAG